MAKSFFKCRLKYLWIVGLISCLFFGSLNVNAYARIDRNQKAQLTIAYVVEHAEFSIYKVAELADDFRFTPIAPFDSYSVTFDEQDNSNWRVLADTLAGYAARDQIAPLYTDVTDAEGKITWENLEAGVYLITGKQYNDGENIYSVTPFFATLPHLTEDDYLDYIPTAIPKYSMRPIMYEDLSTIKIWKDTGYEKERPTEIEVELLKDGMVVDTIKLNKENNWTHTWKALSMEHEWKVMEKEVPEGYTMTASEENGVYEIVNTATKKPPVDNPKLPQTGQLWWPVPILVVAGLFLFLFGWIRKRYEG